MRRHAQYFFGLLFWMLGAGVSSVRAVDAGTFKGGEPPAVIAMVRTGSVAQVQLLLEGKEQAVDAVNQQGQTALMYAADAGQQEVLELLQAAGANVKAVDNYQRSALMFAARKDRSDTLTWLLARELPVDAASKRGYTALHEAAEQGSLNSSRILLKAGATVDAVDRDGHTPLMTACAFLRAELVSQLLAAGADPARVDKYDMSALDFASLAEGDAAAQKKILALLAQPSASQEGGQL